MIALIDFDIIVYRAGFASQKRTYSLCYDEHTLSFDRGVTQSMIKKSHSDLITQGWELSYIDTPEPVENACSTAKRMIERILKATKAQDYRGYLTSNDKTNYRFEIAKTKVYKGHRGEKPIHYDAIRDYLVRCWDAKVISHMEADDAMGIVQTKLLDKGRESVICSIDKDMYMIPGQHFNLVTEKRRLVKPFGALKLDKTGDKAKLTGGGLKWFYAQMLLGDSADNIPGIPGCGPISVYKLLSHLRTEDELLEAVDKQYVKYYTTHSAEVLKEVGTLLWIQQDKRRQWRN